MTDYRGVLDAARQLPMNERIQLLDALWETIPENELPAPSEAWIAEIQRRSAEFDAGRMPTSNWNSVRERSRRAAGLDE